MYDAEKTLGIRCESIMDVIHKEFLTAGGFRWFLKSQPPEKEDFLVTPKPDHSTPILNTSLWNRLGRPSIDKNNPPACMNLSLKDLPEELWKVIPGFEDRFAVSDKGRVKRLSGWTSKGRKIFLKEQILSQYMNVNSDTSSSLYCLLRHNQKNVRISIVKLLYYCFVSEFDLYDKRLLVINKNKPFWNIELSKLTLSSIYSFLKGTKE